MLWILIITNLKLSMKFVFSPNFYFLQFGPFFRAFTSTSVSIWPQHSCATLGKVLLQHIAPANPGEIGEGGGGGGGGETEAKESDAVREERRMRVFSCEI